MLENLKTLISWSLVFVNVRMLLDLLWLTFEYGIFAKFFHITVDATTRIKRLESLVEKMLMTACANSFLFMFSWLLDFFL